MIFSECLALIVAGLFAVVVIYLCCCQGSTIRSHSGFQRYQPLVQDENDSPIIGRRKGGKILKNSRSRFDESDDEDTETLFSSKIKKSMIP